MAKDKKKKKVDKKQRVAEKNERKQAKSTKKQQTKKKAGAQEPEEDLEAILEQFRREQEEQYAVHEEVLIEHPTRRANASFTPGLSNDIYLFGGEVFDGAKSTFYNELLCYDTTKNFWRKYVSGNSPGPRSSHQSVITPDGMMWVFGGEFCSTGNTFFHYRDFWCLDLKTHQWDRLEFKIKPSARSGHRMAVWKGYIVLFGGFFDVGIQTRYLDDLWLFDLSEYKWIKVEIPETAHKPPARSGFSFLPTADGVVLYGGYSKKYTKGERAKGVFHTDCWLLKMSTEIKEIKWEKRRRVGYAPGPRSGCTMALYKNRGILFGGVWDEEDPSGEDLISTFYEDMYSYQLDGGGRWWSVNIKSKKKATAKNAKHIDRQDSDDEDMDMDAIRRKLDEGIELDADEEDTDMTSPSLPRVTSSEDAKPRPRYNAMCAVVKNTLYVFGGLLEIDNVEYTLDDFWTLSLDKLDGYKCLKECDLKEQEWNESEEEDDDGEEDEEDDDDEEEEDQDEEADADVDDGDDQDGLDDQPMEVDDEPSEMGQLTQAELETQARDYLKLTPEQLQDRLLEDSISTPQPTESLRDFYARSSEYWAQFARERNATIADSENRPSGAIIRGKALRRDGFQLAQERYEQMKPLMEQIRRLQMEAEADQQANVEKQAAAAAASHGAGGGARNRR